ncbi:hypothetical protein ABPG75_003722 [Micractinium tetrahymenae]
MAVAVTSWVHPAAQSAGVKLHLLSSPPARVWQAPLVERDTSNCSSGGSSEEQRREELLSACAAALGRALPSPGRGASCSSDVCASGATGRALLIFNLFALEAFHLAEALRIPCLAASPCLVPYAPPAGFERRFRLAHPQLYERLQAADKRRQLDTVDAGSASGGTVGWSDVRHWLWPLFTERWGPWRYHRLGLPEVPFSDRPPGEDLPAPPPLLYGISEAVVPRPGFWPQAAHLCGFWSGQHCFAGSQDQLPMLVATLLASHGAEGVQQQAGGGHSAATQAGLEAVAAAPPSAQAERAPICVDFGSMGLLGLLPHPRLLAAVLQAAARLLGRRMLLLTAGWQPLLEACRELEQQQAVQEAQLRQQQQQEGQQQPPQQQQCQQQQSPWLAALQQPVPHDLLLPHCAAILHHGGAGTVAAALRCGTPQLICPLHFDQRQWAERVAWLGCGAQLSPAALLQDGPEQAGDQAAGDGKPKAAQQLLLQQQAVEEAARGLAVALAALPRDDGVCQQCARLRDQLAQEDGLAAAVALVREQLAGQGQQQVRLQAGQPEQQPPAATSAAAAATAVQAPVQRVELPGGLSVRCISPSEAAFIHGEVFQQNCYFPAGIRLSPGSVVVDAGANIGLFALRVLLDRQLAPAVSRLYAFEPLPPTANVLEANLREHGVADKVMVLRLGLHSAPGSLDFTFYPAMPGNSTAAPAEKWEHQRPAMAALMGSAAADACFQGAASIQCPVTTLAQFAREQRLQRIDLLKVDVEGSELELLRGLDPNTWRLVCQVVAEVHDVGDRLAVATRLLEAAGFAVHAERAHGPAGNWLLFAWQLTDSGDE